MLGVQVTEIYLSRQVTNIQLKEGAFPESSLITSPASILFSVPGGDHDSGHHVVLPFLLLFVSRSFSTSLFGGRAPGTESTVCFVCVIGFVRTWFSFIVSYPLLYAHYMPTWSMFLLNDIGLFSARGSCAEISILHMSPEGYMLSLLDFIAFRS